MTRGKTVRMKIDGMHCVSCANVLARAISDAGAQHVDVQFHAGAADFTAPSDATIESVRTAVEQLGYEATLPGDEKKSHQGLSAVEKKCIFSAILTAPLIIHMVLPPSSLDKPIVHLLLAAPVFIVGLQHFGGSALRALRTKTIHMDVLICIGFISAFCYSLIGLLIGRAEEFLFFETSSAIISFVLLGNVFERRAFARTTAALEELTQLQSGTARKIVSEPDSQDIQTRDIPIQDIAVGDRLLLAEGDRVPVDGLILDGDTLVDESMLTGESVPVERTQGERLVGGTILVRGSGQLEATEVDQDTYLSHLIELVRKAQATKPKIQRLADSISNWFVPLVLACSGITFAVSFCFLDISTSESILRSIAVLVIACPCAMGLATPTALMVSVGRAAKLGVLFKSAESLEEFSKIRQIIFDKTGTLSSGEFSIASLELFDGSREEALSMIKGLELYSSHPIAQSLVHELQDIPAKAFDSVTERKGLAVVGIDGAHQITLGSYKSASDLTRDNSFDLYLRRDTSLVAALRVSDTLRRESKFVVDFFNGQNVKTILLSGDSERKCADAAKHLAIQEVHAEMKPEDKLEYLKAHGEQSAFVGDGINDAPALSAAHIGVSLREASATAIEASDVVLHGSGLKKLPAAFLLAEETLRTIKQNLFWAFFYNTLAIPVAAAGYLSPMFAALIMAFSDIIIVGNSLRLRTRQLPEVRTAETT